MERPPSPLLRRLLIGVSLASIVLSAVPGVLLWNFVSTQQASMAALASRVNTLTAQVEDLKRDVGTSQEENSALKSQVEGSLLTVQDVAFEALKKNDGLVSVWTDPRPGRRAYLTFDDGPSENTPWCSMRSRPKTCEPPSL